MIRLGVLFALLATFDIGEGEASSGVVCIAWMTHSCENTFPLVIRKSMAVLQSPNYNVPSWSLPLLEVCAYRAATSAKEWTGKLRSLGSTGTTRNA